MEYLQYIIPAGALIIVQVIISVTQNSANKIQYDMTIREIKKDLARLEEKQDKHNDLVERVAKLEMKDDAQWKWIDQFKNHLP